MLIGNRTFTGLLPKLSPDLLPDNAAQVATNVKFSSGALDAWKGLTTILTLSSIQPVLTVYRYGQTSTSETQFWFEFTTDVNVVRGPVVTDTEERTYWTDGTYPKKTRSNIATTAAPYPSNSYRMGIPAPATAPTATVTGTPTNGADPSTTSVYVATYVTAWDEESAPGPASNLVTWQPGQAVSVTIPAALAGAYNVNRVRLYRSNTGTSRTSFQYVTEVAIGTPTYSDSKTGSQLGEAASTFDWDPPPDTMIGLTDMGNGILAGFTGNTLCFSEPGVPYAWPVKYQLAFDAPIVGIGAFAQSLFVGTTRGAHIVTGVDPANMTSEQLNKAQSCSSKRSVLEMMGGVVWAAPDGLFHVSASGTVNLTENLISRDQWQAYVPSSMSCYEIDGRCYVTYNTGSVTGTLIFGFGADPTMATSDVYFTAAYQEKQRDSLYVVQSNVLKKWDSGTALSAQWRSKEHWFPSSMCFSCARVEAESYPVTFKLFADGAQLGSDITVSNKYPFRLPAGRAYKISYQVNYTGRVNAVLLATSMPELGMAK